MNKKALFPFVLMVLALVCAGCLYSVEVDPPYSPPSLEGKEPIPLSISIKEISIHFMRNEIEFTDSEELSIDEVFLKTARAEDLFKKIAKRGTQTDLFVEVINYPAVDTSISTKKSLYRDIMTLTGLGFLTPIPYPIFLKTRGVFNIYAQVQNEALLLKQYDATFRIRIWAASLIGARFKRPELMQHITEYVVPVVFGYMKHDYEFYAKCATYIEKTDREGLRSFVEKNTVLLQSE